MCFDLGDIRSRDNIGVFGMSVSTGHVTESSGDDRSQLYYFCLGTRRRYRTGPPRITILLFTGHIIKCVTVSADTILLLVSDTSAPKWHVTSRWLLMLGRIIVNG
jgi:hypothetical protein